MPKKSNKLGKGFVCLPKNPDKSGHQSWNSKSGKTSRSIGNLPNPFRCIFCSLPSAGKTFQCQNLILRQQPGYDAIYIITPNVHTREWDAFEPTDILENIPDGDYWQENHENDRVLVVLEDYIPQTKLEEKSMSSLFRWQSTHCGKYISVMLLFQNFFDILPIARRCANVFVLFPSVDLASRKMLEKRVGLPDGRLTELFKLCKTPRDSIMIDKTVGSPAPLRFNLFNKIRDTLADDDDDFKVDVESSMGDYEKKKKKK